jgi:hypothetical protein
VFGFYNKEMSQKKKERVLRLPTLYSTKWCRFMV